MSWRWLSAAWLVMELRSRVLIPPKQRECYVWGVDVRSMMRVSIGCNDVERIWFLIKEYKRRKDGGETAAFHLPLERVCVSGRERRRRRR